METPGGREFRLVMEAEEEDVKDKGRGMKREGEEEADEEEEAKEEREGSEEVYKDEL
jgi:hypothetical protein